MPLHLPLRRRFLQSSISAGTLSIAAAAGLLKPTVSYAWLPFFNFKPTTSPSSPSPSSPPSPSAPAVAEKISKPIEALLEDLRRARPEISSAVEIVSPEIAVDGASIMLDFKARLPEVDGLAVYIEGNPKPLAAAFYLDPSVLPEMKLMVKLAKSSNVSVVARSRGQFYQNYRFVKVTHGGCSDSFEEAESKHRRDVQRIDQPVRR